MSQYKISYTIIDTIQVSATSQEEAIEQVYNLVEHLDFENLEINSVNLIIPPVSTYTSLKDLYHTSAQTPVVDNSSYRPLLSSNSTTPGYSRLT